MTSSRIPIPPETKQRYRKHRLLAWNGSSQYPYSDATNAGLMKRIRTVVYGRFGEGSTRVSKEDTSVCERLRPHDFAVSKVDLCRHSLSIFDFNPLKISLAPLIRSRELKHGFDLSWRVFGCLFVVVSLWFSIPTYVCCSGLCSGYFSCWHVYWVTTNVSFTYELFYL
jgi:hypothetical protein